MSEKLIFSSVHQSSIVGESDVAWETSVFVSDDGLGNYNYNSVRIVQTWTQLEDEEDENNKNNDKEITKQEEVHLTAEELKEIMGRLNIGEFP
tara:strand:+ start:1232 stop:1510 length:279 start_codon:yes stop_codon:yes gene_type:complete